MAIPEIDLDGKKVLNLGCGLNSKLGWVNMDRTALPGVDVVHDATMPPWPFEDASFDFILASHVLQFLPHFDPAVARMASIVRRLPGMMGQEDRDFLDGLSRRPDNGLVAAMNECWRVMKPGAVMHVRVPTVSANGAYQDPEHRRFFVWSSFLYFGRPAHLVPGTPENARAAAIVKERGGKLPEHTKDWYAADYGIRCWFDLLNIQTDDRPDERFCDAYLRKPLPEAAAADKPILHLVPAEAPA